MFTRAYLSDLLLIRARSVSIIPVTQVYTRRYWLLISSSELMTFRVEGDMRGTMQLISSTSPTLYRLLLRTLKLYPDKISVWADLDQLSYILFIPIPPIKVIPLIGSTGRLGHSLDRSCDALVWHNAKDVLLGRIQNSTCADLRSFVSFFSRNRF